ncbi:SCF ubiquitin ligase complex subunit cdc4 [Coemansia erecta]|nr:SCF ubiquitin ligase complex subunit cdc4 [Coemansia erecta]
MHQLEGHTSKVYTIVLDPDQHLIFSGSMDGTIRVWNWDSGNCLRMLRGHLTLVGLLALKHGTLVSAGADTTLRIWDHPMKQAKTATEHQRPFSNIPGDLVAGPAQPQNMLLNHLHRQALIPPNVGNLQQLHLLQQLQLQQRANDQLHQQQADITPDMIRHETHVLSQHTNAITCFQHDGTKIVSGADSTLKLWDVRTGMFVRDLLSNLSSVWQVQFDKRRCVAAVNRNEVTYFEVIDFQ